MESYEFIRPEGAKTGEFSSWVIEDNYIVIKKTDSSVFNARGTAVDGNVRWFFEADNLQID